jgi:Spy/CpxP family protein refolding chaperone
MKDMQVTCLSSSGPKRQVSRFAAGLAVSLLAAACSSAATSAATSPTGTGQAAATSTGWLCLPGMPDDHRHRGHVGELTEADGLGHLRVLLRLRHRLC